jgi:2-polyprenyl-3-methyl-5-hydroxy-6-metoxy-1,4-benzoquinol methylase
MKSVVFDPSWPESWKLSYQYDQMEIYGDLSHRGYAYAYQNRQQRTLDAVRQVAAPGAKVLDIAAAQGNFSLLLAEQGYDVTWNDLRSELVDYVKLKYEHGLLNFAPGNAFELEFDELFDAVLITEIIEHMAHPDEFLRQVSELVKPGGCVVMTTPNGGYFRNPLPRFSDCPNPEQFESVQFKPDGDGHIFLLHTDEIQSLSAASGLEIKTVKLFTNPLTNGHLKLEALLNFLPRSIVSAIEKETAKLDFPISSKLNIHTLAIFKRTNLE